MQSDLASKHRSKSRELNSKVTNNADPNEIGKEFDGVKDNIRKNLRSMLEEAKQLNLDPDEVIFQNLLTEKCLILSELSDFET